MLPYYWWIVPKFPAQRFVIDSHERSDVFWEVIFNWPRTTGHPFPIPEYTRDFQLEILKAEKTKDLLRYLNGARVHGSFMPYNGHHSLAYDYHMIKEVLSTREHVPTNKAEKKAVRREASQSSKREKGNRRGIRR
jgi:hypothetical protein